MLDKSKQKKVDSMNEIKCQLVLLHALIMVHNQKSEFIRTVIDNNMSGIFLPVIRIILKGPDIVLINNNGDVCEENLRGRNIFCKIAVGEYKADEVEPMALS